MGLLNYTVIPEFKELGFNILAFNFFHYNHEIRSPSRKEEREELIEEHLEKHPNIVFGSSGQGLGYEGLSISVHKDFDDLRAFAEVIEEEWANWITNINSFVVSLEDDNIIRSFSFKHLMGNFKSTQVHD